MTVTRPLHGDYGPIQGGAFGVSTGASLTLASGVAGRTHCCTGAQASGDIATTLEIQSPANTILYRKRFTGAFNISESFDPPLLGASGQDLIVKIAASTANCEVNARGFTISR